MHVPTIWIGTLFAVLCLATLHQRLSLTIAPDACNPQLIFEYENTIRTFRNAVKGCLLTGDYMKCAPYTIETLLLLAYIEHYQSEDSKIEVWMLLGITSRLAFRMGYHREASLFSHISSFRAEMRRRKWALMYQLDVMTSFQYGLPRMISNTQSIDTTEPRNLLDGDFSEDTTILPQSRPSTEVTPVQYVLLRNRLLSVFGSIFDLTTSTVLPLHSKVVELDTVLRDTYEAFPPIWHLRMSSDLIVDNPSTLIAQIRLLLVYHKAQCVLHRRHLLLARTDVRYIVSRDLCITAALEIIELHAFVSHEIEPGQRLYDYRWKAASLIKQEFLLSTTILCSELNDWNGQAIPARACQKSTETVPITKIVDALSYAYPIWLAASSVSWEAHRVTQVLRHVLGRVHNPSSAPIVFSNSSIEEDFFSGAQVSINIESFVQQHIMPAWWPSDIENFGHSGQPATNASEVVSTSD